MNDSSKAPRDCFPATEYRGPLLSVKHMREVDRLMMEKYHIGLLQMMENAGRCLALLSMRLLEGTGNNKDRKITVFAGTGGNGGGAMVAARRLHSWGVEVEVVLAGNEENTGVVVRQQLEMLRTLQIAVFEGNEYLQRHRKMGNLIIDGLVGYSLKGAPRGLVAEVINKINADSQRVVSLDVPSGLHPDTGVGLDPVIKANATLTLALPKNGLCSENAWQFTGDIYLADIGVPSQLYLEPELGFKVPDLFSKGDIVFLKRPS